MISWKQFLTDNITTDEIRLQLIIDYEQLLENGSIGDCLLRTFAESWTSNTGFPGGVVITMSDIANVCYRTFAHKWIKENGK
jgi:hypothetical protein